MSARSRKRSSQPVCFSTPIDRSHPRPSISPRSPNTSAISAQARARSPHAPTTSESAWRSRRHFGTSIEPLQSRFLTLYSYLEACLVVLERIAQDHPDCVIAVAPSGLRSPYLRVVRKLACVTVVIEVRPENILDRITFFDIDSRPIDRHLTPEEKRLHLRAIKGNMAFFKTSYARADLHADVAGLDAEAGAARIEELVRHSGLGR